MESSQTWVILVDEQSQVTRKMFPISTSGDENIHALTLKVKAYWRDLAKVEPTTLSVWRFSDEALPFEYDDFDEMQCQISEAFSKKLVKVLRQNRKIANLHLSEEEVLLVQVPTVGITAGNRVAMVDRKYEPIFLRTASRGIVVKEDIDSNQIEDATEDHLRVPEFLESFEAKLGRKRMLLDDKMRGVVETLVGAQTSQSYFEPKESMSDSSELISVVDYLEFNHIAYISSVDGVKSVKLWAKNHEGATKLFKEADANWLYFYLIAYHLQSHPSNLTIDGKPKIIVKQGQESWPFPLIIRVEDTHYTYKPKSDFLILKFGLPRLAVEVNSYAPGRPAADYHRLMLQGASIVRFANTFLDAYKEKNNFVFVAIFISAGGLADRYFMFQQMGSEMVYRKKRSFALGLREHRVAFALELYNFSSSLYSESGDEATKKDVDELVKTFNNMNPKLPTFTGGKTNHSTGHDRENQPGPSESRKGNDARQVDQLEACGYEVVEDVLETDGGTWELLSKLPRHISTVYRRSDPNKNELIAKRIRKGSNELAILEYLQTKQPQSMHVIQFIEAIPSTTRDWLILPKLHSICDQVFLNSRGVFGRVQLGWGLIEGLGYLHEHKIAHRDVKPDNLVCDSDFRLQIIDFDVAIKVEDEGTEIDEYRGTKGWTAPEMGTEDGPRLMYSPIKADRWSCGRVLLRHIMVGKGDNRLLKFALQLVANDPQQRPSLVERHNLLAPPVSYVANVVKDGRKAVFRPRQDMIEVDRESMKPPDAKKPRLEQRGELCGYRDFDR